MPTINNILNVTVNSVEATGGLNYGNSVNIAQTSEVKALGSSRPIGDFGRNVDFEGNVYIDPDLFDQNSG